MSAQGDAGARATFAMDMRLVRFRFWVAHYGVSRLARSLGTNRQVVQTWVLADNAVTPAMKNIRMMLALSTIEPITGCATGDGPLSYKDILGTVEIVSQERRMVPGTPGKKIVPATRGIEMILKAQKY